MTSSYTWQYGVYSFRTAKHPITRCVCWGWGWGPFSWWWNFVLGFHHPLIYSMCSVAFSYNTHHKMTASKKLFSSHSCSSLQVLFDLGGVLSIETLQFLVELHVTLIDVAHILFLIKASSPAVLLPLLNPGDNGYMYLSS